MRYRMILLGSVFAVAGANASAGDVPSKEPFRDVLTSPRESKGSKIQGGH